MNNLGKANIKVELLNTLMGIEKQVYRYNLDLTASQWEAFNNSPYFKPLLTEYIADEDGSFAAIFPTKRKFYVNNFMKYSDGTTNAGTSPVNPYIVWTAISDKKGVVADIFSPTVNDQNPKPYDSYKLEQPQKTYPESYIGPKWSDSLKSRIAPTNDSVTIQTFLKSVGLLGVISKWTVDAQPDDNKLNWINQHVTRDGLWWGIESNGFLTENMPIWINMNITKTPPTSNHETIFVISLGMDDEGHAYDILLSQNNKPVLYDYYLGRSAKASSGTSGSTSGTDSTSGPPVSTCTFDVDLSRILDTQQDIEIGIMAVAGRLVIWVNQVYMIYTRQDKSDGDEHGELKECKIGKGKMRIYGSNVQATINVCPMNFAPMGVVATPVPSIVKTTEAAPIKVSYKGVQNNGTFGGSVGILPQQPDHKGQLFGVDCLSFYDENAVIHPTNSNNPYNIGLHKKGLIYFYPATAVGITVVPKSDYYTLIFRTSNTSMTVPSGSTFNIPYGGCPYFFRIKGGYVYNPNTTTPRLLPVPEVIDASESSSAPDYFHALTNASVTIYNEGGKFDFLKDKQYGIRIYWGWNGSFKKTFTGVITGVNTSETPGMETLTLQCEDYMFILKNTPIINSPFYDGMIGYYAIADLAKRGGISQFVNDMVPSSTDYFLPSGYTFTSPVLKFPSRNMIFQCMMDIVKKFEAFVYFDEEGRLHCSKLPGGLFSVTRGASFAARFSRDPNQADPSKIILNERNVEYSYASTVNHISVMSINRDTREGIMYATQAPSANDHLLYKRVYLVDQAALGDVKSVKTWVARLSQRIYWPIRKTNFSTVGTLASSINYIFQFVKVDSLEYRIMSLSRKYSAGDNSFTNEYGVEWLGGK